MFGQVARARVGSASTGSSLARRLRRISALERREEARAFLDAYHDATEAGHGARARRWSTVRRDLARHGWYEHTPEELAFGARIAWRNHGRCIGRLFWESLEVFDCRTESAPEQIADRVLDHVDHALDQGRVRSVISVFAPVQGAALPSWIESPQIFQYAGHSTPDGVIGDRQNIDATRIALQMGWAPVAEPGRFDLLPFFVRDAQDRRLMFELPRDRVHEVPLTHSEFGAFDALGLRWYALPIVSNMILTVGGIDYPCAPFNGFYMATEIANRNLSDARRYDLLPEIAESFGIVPTQDDKLWKDAALSELNRAVLQSYRNAGVTLVDHHTASDQFMTFHRREQSAGRRVAADWRWIVPPQASSATEVFHLKMRNFHPVPNYYRDRGGDGRQLMPWYGDRYRRRPQVWKDRLVRRWKIWKRMAW